MAGHSKPVGWAKAAILAALQIQPVTGTLWNRASNSGSVKEDRVNPAITQDRVPQVFGAGSELPDPYQMVLDELKAFQSGPLCHRTAARLLTTNCEVLEGKDEATLLTDGGALVRDIVDSYAASLAICDLERADFDIPEQCAQFREPALSQLPVQNPGQLHVSPAEISDCLKSLVESPSAWNTWVNYRHKALGFCETARVGNAKVQHVFLFERLTKIMGQFTNDVDKQFKQHLSDFNLRARETGDKIDELSPKVDNLKALFNAVEDLLLNQVSPGIKETTELINVGTDNALNLQRLLAVMFKGVLEGHAEVAATYEQSIQAANQRVESAMDSAMKSMALATESAINLHTQIESSRLHAAELEMRQNNLEEGMQRLMNMSENLTVEYDDHANHLLQARKMMNVILDSLEDTAASAILVKNSIPRQSASSWWPYIFCPMGSVWLGSYQLPPSGLRNLGLIVVGEAAGLLVSIIQSYSPSFSFISTIYSYPLRYVWDDTFPASNIHSNATI
ncbi:hypothetical protein F5Y02DRAFT_196469 [Annulohypoxylon stygium]|nr:hypothetical protein F5Y02DRAFT_196469 [Annulohypoxylon stygium]